MSDLVKEAKKWIDTDHILCADGYEQAEEIIPALLDQLEAKDKQLKTCRNDALMEAAKTADELYKHHYDHSSQKHGAMDAAKAIKELLTEDK